MIKNNKIAVQKDPFLNWDSIHARLISQYEAWSTYKD